MGGGGWWKKSEETRGALGAAAPVRVWPAPDNRVNAKKHIIIWQTKYSNEFGHY